MSEGTYPYALGGVSLWCDQLVRGMPDYRWEMVALTVDGTEREVWKRPGNLECVRSIPMWSAAPFGRRRRRPAGAADHIGIDRTHSRLSGRLHTSRSVPSTVRATISQR